MLRREGARLLRGGPQRHHRRWAATGQPQGLRLEGRLKAVVASLDRVAEKGG